MKRLKVFLFTIAFIISTLGHASTSLAQLTIGQEVMNLLEHTQYQINVEWDQQGQQQYQQILENFQQQIIELKAQGLTQDAFFQAVSESIENPKTQASFQQLAETLNEGANDQLSEEEIQMAIDQFLSGQASGAHWMADAPKKALYITIVAILGVAYFAYGGYCIFHPDRGTPSERKACLPLTNFLDHM